MLVTFTCGILIRMISCSFSFISLYAAFTVLRVGNNTPLSADGLSDPMNHLLSSISSFEKQKQPDNQIINSILLNYCFYLQSFNFHSEVKDWTTRLRLKGIHLSTLKEKIQMCVSCISTTYQILSTRKNVV